MLGQAACLGAHQGELSVGLALSGCVASAQFLGPLGLFLKGGPGPGACCPLPRKAGGACEQGQSSSHLLKEGQPGSPPSWARHPDFP